MSEEEVESRDDEGQELSHLIHLLFAHLKQHTRAKRLKKQYRICL